MNKGWIKGKRIKNIIKISTILILSTIAGKKVGHQRHCLDF
jgi:hypothetical protein